LPDPGGILLPTGGNGTIRLADARRGLPKDQRSQVDLREVGVSGTRLQSGQVFEDPNVALQGQRGLQLLQQMSMDPTVAAALRSVELPIRAARWYVEPASEDPKHVAMADYCLPGDQLILDGTGVPVPIADVHLGDLVLTKEGRARRVTHKSQRHHTGEIVTLRVAGYPHPIRLTPEHRVPTTAGWTRAGEITVGDELFRPCPELVDGGSYEDGWVLGLFLAEGSFDRRRPTVVFTVHQDEAPLVADRLREWVERYELMPYHRGKAIEPRIHYRHTKAANVTLTHPTFRSFIGEWATADPGRRIGSLTMRLNRLPTEKEFARGVLDGWHYGDGSVSHGILDGSPYMQSSAVTSSRALAHQMQLLAGALGIPGALYVRPPKLHTILGKHTVFNGGYALNLKPARMAARKRTEELVAVAQDLRAGGMSYKRISTQIGVTEMSVWNWLNVQDIGRRPWGHQCRVEDRHILHRVVSVETEPYDGLVFDLTVDEDHTFCAGVIAVSNCHYVLWEFGTQSMDDVLRQALTMNWAGFSVSEIVYDIIEDGEYANYVGWAKLAYRSQLSKYLWNVEEVDSRSGSRKRELVSMTQQAPPTYEQIVIPREKLLIWVHDMLGENWDGTAMIRQAFQPWTYKDTLRKIQAIGLERSYVGIPHISFPEDFSASEVVAAQQIGQNMRVSENAAVIAPEHIGVALLTNKIEGRAMQDAIDHHDTAILMSILAQFVQLGTKGVGSYSLSTDQSELFLMAIGAVANYTAQVFNLVPGIPTLMRYNFAGVTAGDMPRLVHGPIGQRNFERLARGLGFLAQWGILTPDDSFEDWVREQLEAPERDKSVTPEALKTLIETIGGEAQFPHQHQGPRWPIPGTSTGMGVVVGGQPVAPPAAADGATPSGAEITTSAAQNGRQKFSEAWARRPWQRPQGRLTDVDRNRIRATEAFVGALADVRSEVGQKPERPSVRMARTRRPYQIRMSEPTPEEVVRKVNADAKAGRLRRAGVAESVVVPQHRVIASQYEGRLSEFIAGLRRKE
jgi:hypothetical protein